MVNTPDDMSPSVPGAVPRAEGDWDPSGDDRIALTVERAVVGKRWVDRGGVRVATRTETLTETVRETVEETEVEVERVPVGRVVEAAEGPRTEGDVTILPVYEERLVVQRQLVLVEEIHVRRLARRREVEEPVALRRQVAVVDRLEPRGDITETPITLSGATEMMDDTLRGTRTVTAMFDSEAEAERAVARLRAAGIPESQINVTHGAATRAETVAYDDPSYREQHRGFWDSLSDFLFPDEDRYAYAEGLARGSHMVAVRGFDAAHYDTVVDILDDEGSVDLNSREEEWRSSGWSDYRSSDYYDRDADMNTRGTIYDDGMQDRSVQMAADMGRRSQADLGSQQAGYATGASMRQSGAWDDRDVTDDATVKVVQEDIAVGKRDVDQGRVRVRSYVREEPVEADVELRSTRVFVERRPVDRAAMPGEAAFQDRTIEAREHAEEAVVSKEARVVEEIGLRKETETRVETVQDTVRKTEVEIEDERTGETQRLTGDDRDRY